MSEETTYKRAPAPQSSPYLAVAPDGPTASVRRVEAEQLREITTALLVRASYHDAPVVIATIPEALSADRTDPRFRQLAADGATVVLLGRALERYVSETGREPHLVPLREDDPLWTEWNVVVCAADLRSAFVARAIEPSAAVQPPGGTYGWVTERDAASVARLARILLDRAPHLGLEIPPESTSDKGVA